MTQPPEQQPSAQQLILDLIAQGRTQREIAQLLGRSEDMVYMVKKGRRPGANLVASLRQIVDGHEPDPVPRRRNRAGETVFVRAPGGRTIEPVQPRRRRPRPPESNDEEPRPRPRPGEPEPSSSRSTDRPETRRTPLRPGRNLFRHHENIIGAGRETHLIQFPRTNRPQRDDQVTDLMNSIVTRAARRGGRFQMTATVEIDDENGQRQRVQVPCGEKGGYSASNVLRELQSNDTALDWVATQVGSRYGAHEGVIVALDISVW